MVSKSKLKQKRKDKSKINIKQKQGTHIKIHVDNSKHTKKGVTKMNPRQQPTIIHTNSPSQSQPFLIYNNPLQPPQIPLGEISKVKNTIGEKPRDIVKQSLYDEETEPISIGDLQKEKEIYATPIYKSTPIYGETKKGINMDELKDRFVHFRRPEEERQQEKDNLIEEIKGLGGDEKDIFEIKNSIAELKRYRARLKKEQKILPEK
jgi:hypothetical protein